MIMRFLSICLLVLAQIVGISAFAQTCPSGALLDQQLKLAEKAFNKLSYDQKFGRQQSDVNRRVHALGYLKLESVYKAKGFLTTDDMIDSLVMLCHKLDCPAGINLTAAERKTVTDATKLIIDAYLANRPSPGPQRIPLFSTPSRVAWAKQALGCGAKASPAKTGPSVTASKPQLAHTAPQDAFVEILGKLQDGRQDEAFQDMKVKCFSGDEQICLVSLALLEKSYKDEPAYMDIAEFVCQSTMEKRAMFCSHAVDYYTFDKADVASRSKALKYNELLCSRPTEKFAAQGCRHAAIAYDEGEIVTKDKVRTMKFGEKYCYLEPGDYCGKIVSMLIINNPTESDGKKARKISHRMCAANKTGSSPYIVGCYLHGYFHVTGQGGIQDLNTGRKYLERSCDKNYGAACLTYAASYVDSEVIKQLPPDYLKARPYMKKACDLDEALACKILAEYQANGRGGPKQPAISKQTRRKACKLGDKSSCL